MTEKIKQIARRIKELREIAGFTQEAVASALKIPGAQYKKYESGKAEIPVSFLYEVAQKFKVELTALLTGEEPRMRVYSLVRSGKGPEAERRKEYKYHDLAYNFIHKKAEVFMVTVDPQSKKPLRYNSHPGQEFTYVLEGKMKILLDGHELILNRGDSLYFDSGYKHAMTALNGSAAKFLAVII